MRLRRDQTPRSLEQSEDLLDATVLAVLRVHPDTPDPKLGPPGVGSWQLG